jgi:predicted nucleotidyltransferase
MSDLDRILDRLRLPKDPTAWTDEHRQIYRLEHLKGALDAHLSRHERNLIVWECSRRIRKPEKLSEEELRRRVEDEINCVDPAKAKKNARITQKGGLEILAKFLQRADEANRQPFAYSVGAIILFGSWDRNDKTHAGDIDVAVEFIPKAAGEEQKKLAKSRQDAAIEAGRNLRDIFGYHRWPREEVAKFLRNHSRGISLADLDSISEGMDPEGKPFSYTILRGDPDTIAKKFEHSEFKLKACRVRQRNPETGGITMLFDDGTLNKLTPTS